MAENSQSNYQVEAINTITSISKNEWNWLVEHASQGSPFHRYEWLRAIETTLEQPAEHVIVRKDSNIVGGLPNFIVDMEKIPFQKLVSIQPGFGGPLITTDKKQCYRLIFDKLSSITSGRTIVHEIRSHDLGYIGYNSFLKHLGYSPTLNSCRFVVPLANGYESVWNRMSRNRQRKIEQGRSFEHEFVEEELTPSNISQFHTTYSHVMNRVGGDTFPESLLNNICEMDEHILLYSILIEGEHAGGAFVLLDHDKRDMHGWLLAVSADFFEYKASELLYDGLFRWGIENDYLTYDMGSTGPDFDNGLYKFKSDLGGEVVPNLTWERGISPVWPFMRTARSVYWSQLKST